MALGLTQPLTEMSTRNISWGQRWPVHRADNLTTFVCRLSWNLEASTCPGLYRNWFAFLRICRPGGSDCWKQAVVLYVQVTVHRDNLRTNNQQGASSTQNFILSRNSTSFGHLLCPKSGFICCARDNWYVSCRLCGRCLGESGWNSRQRSHNLHETYQLPRVKLITPDDGHSRCPKHVEFRDKIKFWILDASCWLFVRSLSLSSSWGVQSATQLARIR
jgi:hypothetical protein